MGSHSVLQRIFPTHCRQIVYRLSHQKEIPKSRTSRVWNGSGKAEDEWVRSRDMGSGLSDGGERGEVMKMTMGVFGCQGAFQFHRSLGTGMS